MDTATQLRRTRRSSITQHLQRVFHRDKLGDQRQSNTMKSNKDAVTISTSYQEHGLATQKFKEPLSHDGGIDAKERDPHSPILDETESRYYSEQSTPTGIPRQSHGISPEDGASDLYISPAWDANAPQKKERRATRRLEAERIELEKRLMKLEKAEMTPEFSLLRREPRRLTKKQPLGSSSRTSSVSADESRSSSTRLSSIFSRRTSRSRSSSVNEDEKGIKRRQSDGTGQKVGNHSVMQSAAPPLSMTLPERFGTAISKGLAATNSALLPRPRELMIPQQLHHPETVPLEAPGNGRGDNFGGNGASSLQLPESSQSHPPIAEKGVRIGSDTPTELDRDSFAASLKVRKRNSVPLQHPGGSLQSLPIQKTTTQVEGHRDSNKTEPSLTLAAPEFARSAKATRTQSFPISLQSNSFRNSPIRIPTEIIPQRHHKKFTSSPLAGSPTINDIETVHDASVAIPTVQSSSDTKRSASLMISPRNVSSKRDSSVSLVSTRALNESHVQDKKKTSRSSLELSHHLRNKTWGRLPQGLRSSSDGTTPPSGEMASSNQTKRHSMSTSVSGYIAQQPNDQRKLIRHDLLRDKDKDHKHYHLKHVNQGQGTITENRLEAIELTAFGGDINPEDPGAGLAQRALADGAGPSSVSLSTDMSQDPGSEEYNTADEATSAADSQRRPVEQPKCDPDGPPASMSSRTLGRDQVVAKTFLICCHCKHWHDIPSGQRKLTECRCCWCEHQMKKSCCQGWSTSVHMRERQH